MDDSGSIDSRKCGHGLGLYWASQLVIEVKGSHSVSANAFSWYKERRQNIVDCQLIAS